MSSSQTQASSKFRVGYAIIGLAFLFCGIYYVYLLNNPYQSEKPSTQPAATQPATLPATQPLTSTSQPK